MTITVSTLAPDAYARPRAIIGIGDPYKLYGYEAMKLILDGLNAAGADQATALLGCLRTGVQNRASVLGTYCFDANGDTTLRTYGLYGIQRQAARLGREPITRRVSSAMPSSVSVPETRARRARRATRPRRGSSTGVAAQPGRDEHVAAAQERDRVRAGVDRLVGAREASGSAPAARARAGSRRSFGGGSSSAARRSSQSTGRRLSGSTSDRQSSSSPW